MTNKLGEKEKRCLLLSYLPRKRVAEIMGVKETTINSHREHIFNKLNVSTLVEAVLVGLKEGHITLEEFTMKDW